MGLETNLQIDLLPQTRTRTRDLETERVGHMQHGTSGKIYKTPVESQLNAKTPEMCATPERNIRRRRGNGIHIINRWEIDDESFTLISGGHLLNDRP